MKRLLDGPAIAATLACLFAPGIAQAAPEAITCDMVRALPLVEAGSRDAGVTFEETPDGCIVRNLVPFPETGISRWQIGMLDIRGQWEAPENPTDLAHAAPPPALSVKARDIIQIIETDDPVMNYQFRVQQKPIAITLYFGWDPDSGIAHLAELSLAGEVLGRANLALTARLPGDATIGDWQKADLRVESLRLFLKNHSLVESFLIPPLLATLPRDTDPASLVEAYRQRFTAGVEALTDTLVSEDSKQALTAFAQDFPNPTGTFKAEIRFTEAISPLSALAECREPPFCLEKLQARYEPATPWQPGD
ncbi:MAG: hypothetical protein KAG89_07705 [Fulvimarina manganoxydans]|uniref:hypothetical protein n=1 Tax=Fulvimarina manganoxydans TaxID=937218 RepID=UPI002354EE7E|nr:hypothetical protein [Fulvimarina manganoxydans]MCK5932045.1 hypothetical protein [Fulvimarina manganoxydans]